MKRIKNFIITLFAKYLPGFILYRFLPKKIIFYGHLISDDKNHVISNYYHYPSINDFKEIYNLYTKLGYSFVDLNDFINNNNTSKSILLTFDDGFIELFKNRKVLKDLNIPYIVFIITDSIDNENFEIKSQFGTKESLKKLYLNIEQINILKNENVSIGFHTRNHVKIPEPKYFFEKETSIACLIPEQYAEIFSHPLLFAYPYAAPEEYTAIEDFLKEEQGYNFFFDTKGFVKNDGKRDHFFRVAIDFPLTSKAKNGSIFAIREQLVINILKRLF